MSTHTTTTPPRRRALVTGASGFVGGQLVPRLLADGFVVRVLTRHRAGLAGHDWADAVEVVEGDARERHTVARALAEVEVAYYLIHSMEGGDFTDQDRELARTFAQEADRAGVSRIVYLGGLHPADASLSPHLASRVEIGQILLDGPVPAACLQAAIVLGAGSASYDMLRYLAGRLPVMVAPAWIDNPVQPIALEDALRCLRAAADLPAEVNRTFDIAGPDVLTYRELMQTYAEVAGLRRRWITALPVLTPDLASLWVGGLTPVQPGLARPLIASLVHPMVAQEHDLDAQLERPNSVGVRAAIREALRHTPPDTGPRNLVACSLAVAAAAGVGSLATQTDSRWYARLDKPRWQPPRAAFPIAWSSLYAVIAGVSAAHLTQLERESKTAERDGYRAALGGNLVLNALWSALFFRAHRLPLAVLEAAALTASSADLARRAGSTASRRRTLLLPYAGWCAFATALTTSLARRNRRAR